MRTVLPRNRERRMLRAQPLPGDAIGNELSCGELLGKRQPGEPASRRLHGFAKLGRNGEIGTLGARHAGGVYFDAHDTATSVTAPPQEQSQLGPVACVQRLSHGQRRDSAVKRSFEPTRPRMSCSRRIHTWEHRFAREACGLPSRPW
jgi:hypothetical protein